jgi:hypothetical protein
MGYRTIATRFRAKWDDLCHADDFAGRWVALDNVRYAPGTNEPLEADVVDVDDDLVELCNRMRAADQTSCCVVQCTMKRGVSAIRRAVTSRSA